MKGFFCCFKGGSSKQVEEAQETTQRPPTPAESTNRENQPLSRENDDLDDQHLFGDNQPLNRVWRNYIEQKEDGDPQASSSASHPLSQYGVAIRWSEIFQGTLNLRDNFFLGRGNFGEVYRCGFSRLGKAAAVKIQHLHNEEANSEFAAELTTLHAANHPNVINLLGKCIDGEHRAIIYEFMPRGSLERHIYADTRLRWGVKQKYAIMKWERRMQIAVGVANALIYVHEELKTIHRDVKLSNVLLDENFVPKLTDFGLATKIVLDKDGVEQQIKIYPVKGTPGCIAPETEKSGLVSSKSDVYSYGVFLLTLFTGRKAFDSEKLDEARKLTYRLRPVWSSEEYMPLIIDVALGKRFSVEGLKRLFQAARMCMDPQVLARPNMRVVKTMVLQAAAYEVPESAPVTKSRSL